MTMVATARKPMTAAEFTAYARSERDKRDSRGEAEAEEHYGLVLIGRNPNNPACYGLQNEEGTIYRIEGYETVVHGWMVGELFVPATERVLCPDQLRLNKINERLERIGSDFRIWTKHRAARRVLFNQLREVA